MKRSAALIMGIMTSYLYFGVNFLINLALIPIMLHFLGNVRYGLWLTLLSVVGYVGIMDLGSTFTVSKYFAAAQGEAPERKMSRLLSTALLMYLALGLLALLLVVGLSFFVARGFSLPGAMSGEATFAFLIIGLNLALSFPLNVFSGLLFGRKQVVAYNIFNVLGVVLGFGGTLLSLMLGHGLVSVAGALLLSNLVVSFGRIWFVKRQLPGVNFDLRLVEPALFRQLFLFGSLMFILGVGGQIIFNTDNIVIAKCLGIGLVASYAIAFRVNQVALSFINKLADTFFPFYAELHALGDRAKLRLYLFESSQFSAVMAFFVFIFMVFWGKPLLTLWLGQDNFIGRPVFFLLALIVLMSSLVHLPAVILQGMGKIRSVVGFNLAEAALNLGLSILLVFPYGVFGVALGTVLAMAVTSLWYVPYRVCRETGSSFRHYLLTTILVPAGLTSATALLMVLLDRWLQNGQLQEIFFKGLIALVFQVSVFLIFGLDRQRKAFYFDRFMNFRDNVLAGGVEMNYEKE